MNNVGTATSSPTFSPNSQTPLFQRGYYDSLPKKGFYSKLLISALRQTITNNQQKTIFFLDRLDESLIEYIENFSTDIKNIYFQPLSIASIIDSIHTSHGTFNHILMGHSKYEENQSLANLNHSLDAFSPKEYEHIIQDFLDKKWVNENTKSKNLLIQERPGKLTPLDLQKEDAKIARKYWRSSLQELKRKKPGHRPNIVPLSGWGIAAAQYTKSPDKDRARVAQKSFHFEDRLCNIHLPKNILNDAIKWSEELGIKTRDVDNIYLVIPFPNILYHMVVEIKKILTPSNIDKLIHIEDTISGFNPTFTAFEMINNCEKASLLLDLSRYPKITFAATWKT